MRLSFSFSLAVSLWSLLLLALASCTTDGGFSAGSTLRSLDNDTFQRSDDQYTSGLAFSYVSELTEDFAGAPIPEPIALLAEDSLLFPAGRQHFAIYSISHRIFTPTDLEATAVVEEDLPYSASLYGTTVIGSQSHNQLNALSFSFGVVGPWALGKELQSAYHEVIHSEDPAGWDNQLENEPLLNFGLDSRRRLLSFGDSDGFGGDVLGGLSASLGNLQTQSSAATSVRLGLGVPSNFHMQGPFLAEESLGLRSHDRVGTDWSVYGFGGLAATWLMHAIYLDGNTFEDSHEVSYDHFVARASFGLAVRYKKFLLAYSTETATVPWDHPDGLDYENYGRIAVSWDF